jgi:hypothetical protein
LKLVPKLIYHPGEQRFREGTRHPKKLRLIEELDCLQSANTSSFIRKQAGALREQRLAKRSRLGDAVDRVLLTVDQHASLGSLFVQDQAVAAAAWGLFRSSVTVSPLLNVDGTISDWRSSLL